MGELRKSRFRNTEGKIMKGEGLNCLLLHTPKFDNWYKPLGDFIWINYLPVGIFALADYLVQHGYSSKIVHLGIEWIEDHHFNIVDFLEENKPGVVALSLHWHHQAYDVMKLAEAIKNKYPDVFIVVGGFTASYYHREILEEFPFVDAVIRGEAEIPLLKLVEKLTKKEGHLQGVPNLTWNKNGEIMENELSYIATEEDLNRLRFTNIRLLNNYETYVNYVGHPFLWKKSFSKEQNFSKLSIRSKTFPLALGRGCPVSCTWCSGSAISQQFITKRTKPVYRSIDKIVDSIKEALEYGYETMYVVFDPFPDKQEFFIDLFAKIREEKITCEMVFECHGLPTRPFIDAFHNTFPTKESFLCISPETGSERLRKIHKHHFYSNKDLLDCLSYLKEINLSTEIFFTYGIPGETPEDLKETIRLKKYIKKTFKNVHCIRVLSIEMEPGAPWYLDPAKYGIINDRPRFRDFYNAHSSKYNQTFSSLGYFIPDYFPSSYDVKDAKGFERALQKIKCKHFCFLTPNPRESGPAWLGRLFCNFLSLMDKLVPAGNSKKKVV